MTRRVEGILRQAARRQANVMTDALTWAGTIHVIGAKLLREYAEQIGLQPNFTIHDREDSADLLNLFRHQPGVSQTESRFLTKATCLSIYSRAINAEMPIDAVLQEHFPWCSAPSHAHFSACDPSWSVALLLGSSTLKHRDPLCLRTVISEL